MSLWLWCLVIIVGIPLALGILLAIPLGIKLAWIILTKNKKFY